MIRNLKVKILWLTDIHFSSDYRKLKGNPTFTAFIENFILEVTKAHTATEPFDYIFITGDLAQKGNKQDYNALFSLLLDNLFKALINTGHKKPVVLTIPGNHDVNWEKNPFLGDFIKGIQAKPKISRSEFYKQKRPQFVNLFSDYSNAVTKRTKGRFSPLFSLDNLDVSGYYRENRLYGHVVDEKNKLIVVLLNSSWFSMGSGFDKLYSDYIQKSTELPIKSKKVFAKEIGRWLKVKDDLTEYNRQITGIELFDYLALQRFYDNYPDYFIVSVMHHPRNWLEWNESYSYEIGKTKEDITTKGNLAAIKDSPGKQDKPSVADILNLIINGSDVLLTGHEHVPIKINCERILDNVLHLKGGCFMNDKQYPTPNFDNCWFSILDINVGNKDMEQRKIYFNAVNDSWKAEERPTPYGRKTRKGFTLTSQRKEKTISALKSGTREMFGNYLSELLSAKLQIKLVLEQPSPIYLIKKEGDKASELCILALMEGMYQNQFRREDFFSELVNQLTSYADLNVEIKTIRFVVLDLFVDGGIKQKYEDNDCDRDMVFSQIANFADNMFDIIRYNFFLRWEPKSEAELQTQAYQEKFRAFHRFKDIMFINHIIRYWDVERFWN